MAAAVEVSARRKWRVALVGIVAFAVLEIGLSFWRPHVVPRLAFLPRPAAESWSDGCNTHYRDHERSGPFWEVNENSTLIGCIED